MIKEHQSYLNKLRVLFDILIIWVAFGLSFWFRFRVSDSGIQALTIQETILPIALIVPLFIVLYHMFDLYSAKRTKRLHIEIGIIFQTNLIVSMVLFMGLFLFKLTNYSRLMLFTFFFLNIFLTCLSRIIMRYILKTYRSKGYNLKHCLVIGSTPTASLFIEKVNSHKHWGFNIVGVVNSTKHNKDYMDEASATNINTHFEDMKVIGQLDQLEEILNEYTFDMIFIALEANEEKHMPKVLYLCEKSGIKTSIIPYYHRYVPAKPQMDDLDGLPVIDIRHVPLDNLFKKTFKRMFDIIFSLCAIIVTSPLLIFSAIMVRCSSKGPILFKQERVGLNQKTFYMYKFRSMKVQTADEEKTEWTTKNDPRKTRWGTFMRKTSIDELPQFFNVLKGDMTVVGPRPERPYFVEKFKEDIPRYMIKHQVRPGITGWAQVNGFRGDTSIEGRIDHDLYYIENWTFGFDLKIVILTVVKGFINKNAY
ncbi:MAG: undecaprenyl-phosphate glucose phosphotransferase [Epulopiscium sp. Nele67-Bin005]|nr:MAG: undecaprenyl-phosphate glucose phosphotransferase [Epulopiscium sp. Nele67-Bin005]